MPTTEKIEKVAELAGRIEGSSALLLAEYRGLTVSEISELRRSLKDAGTTFAVVKNTIMQRAASAAGMDELRAFLTGPSAVAFVGGDPVTAAKALTGVAKRYPALVLKGGWMDGRPLTAEEARSLADLDTRDVMLSKLAGMLQSEMARAAAMFQAAQARFVSLLEAYREKLPAAAGEAPVGDDVAEGDAAGSETAEPETAEPETVAATGDGSGQDDGSAQEEEE